MADEEVPAAAPQADQEILREVFGSDDEAEEAAEATPGREEDAEAGVEEEEEEADVIVTARSKPASMRSRLQAIAQGKKAEGEGACLFMGRALLVGRCPASGGAHFPVQRPSQSRSARRRAMTWATRRVP